MCALFDAEENASRTPTWLGPTEIRTRVAGFKVLSAHHYTMGPTPLPCPSLLWPGHTSYFRTYN